MAKHTITARTQGNVDDEYSAEVELTDDEYATVQGVLTVLAEARADYTMPRPNPRPIVELT
jgi:hypothetical protein